jgi:hypothetical protein
MTVHTALSADDVVISSTGRLAPEDLDVARRAVVHAAETTRDTVFGASVRLVHLRNPALELSYTARASLHVDGVPVRAHAVGATAGEAISAMERRLRGQLARLHHRYRLAGDPDAFPRSRPGRRRSAAAGTGPAPRVLSHPPYELPSATVDEAVHTMDLMDFDFHLFREAETDRDTVLYRTASSGYRLAQVRPKPGWRPRATAPVTVSPRPAARHTLPAAIDHLEAAGLPFLFYAVASGRGRLLYHRHDGNYGLIVPSD